MSFFTCVGNNQKSNTAEHPKYFYWEDMTDIAKDSVLSSTSINENVLKFYRNQQLISDNKFTYSLIDSIVNWHNNSRELYFYLFNKICNSSDGAVSEILGIHCLNIILNDPNYVLNYFRRDKNIERLYAQLIGSEFYFKEEGTSIIKYNYEEFKKIINNKINDDNKSIKEEFYNFIEQTMTEMN